MKKKIPLKFAAYIILGIILVNLPFARLRIPGQHLTVCSRQRRPARLRAVELV